MENARTTVSSVIGNKPVDASDIKVINYVGGASCSY